MVLTIIVLDAEENFIQYLNPELTQISEEHIKYGIRTLDMEYYVQGIKDYKNLFRIGNKIWISGDKHIDDCLYIINTPVENDLFDQNNVVFQPEEKLVELNYVYFSQKDIDDEYFIDSLKTTVIVDYNLLNDLFGDYFSIGIIQDCLSDYMKEIAPRGTMSLLQLLRFIEEETGNVFVTRYEKDINSNEIHCYLDFLNPKSTSKQWELHLFYRFPTDEANEVNSPVVSESEDIYEKDDIVSFPEYVYETPLDPSNLTFRIKYDDEILFEEDAITLGFTGDDDLYEFLLEYYDAKLHITINNSEHEAEGYSVIIPNDSVFEISDVSTGKVVYRYTLHPKLYKVHEETIDLGFNAENINFETDESDTYLAIAPIINSDSLSHAQLGNVIANWLELEVQKGTRVPMIVQKRMITGTQNDPCTSLSNAISRIGNNYYSRPVNPNDSTDSNNKSYEFWVATAYWNAPFSKLKNELYVADDNVTGIEYTHIQGNIDHIEESSRISTPKTGSVETSDEDPYAIFNDVCMKLKDKRYPEVDISVDVANLIDGKFNNYNIFDKVYIKIPGFDDFVTATVQKTTKNPFELNENKIELSNYSVNKKVAQKETMISATNMSFKYPEMKTLTARLINTEYSGDSDSIQYIPNRLLTFTVYTVENDTQTLTGKVYTKVTDDNGYASINLGLTPANYIIDIQFGGDEEYASTNSSVKVNVAGSKEVETTVKKQKKANTYYTKYGVSPDKKTLISIGRNSSGNKFYITYFKRKCPICGSTELYWSIFWAGDEHKSVGVFPVLYKKVKGSNKGRIYCKKCEHGWNALGEALKSGDKNLTVSAKTKASTKAKAYELKKGDRKCGTTLKTVEMKKVTGNTGSELTRSSENTGSEYSGVITDTVRKRAKNIVGNSKGIPAAKKIAKWIGKNIKFEKREGLYQSPATTLKRKKGNCLTQTDLFLQMCDATGVTKKYDLRYIWVGGEKYGKRHFFARINGVDVDVTSKAKNPWGHAVYKGRTIRNRTVYPKLPLTRKYLG